jgi:replicative DNA helicase
MNQDDNPFQTKSSSHEAFGSNLNDDDDDSDMLLELSKAYFL